MGEERLALELAELHKDFNIVCRICLEKGDDEALERYKAKYANENFEEYYFNYLNRKGNHCLNLFQLCFKRCTLICWTRKERMLTDLLLH